MPLLSGVAKTVLEQVVSASAAERNWSIYGKIKDESRNRPESLLCVSLKTFASCIKRARRPEPSGGRHLSCSVVGI